MEIYDSPLNLAHLEGRRAEAFLENGKFQEAIKCHQKAAEYFQQAKERTLNKAVLESLELQRRDHIKQQQIIEHKAKRAAAYVTQKQKTPPPEKPFHRTETPSPQPYSPTIHDGDSLLYLLNNGKLDRYNVSHIGTKIPKDSKQFIEELVVKNNELARFLQMALEELREVTNERDYLRELVQLDEKTTQTSERSPQEVKADDLKTSSTQDSDEYEPYSSLPTKLKALPTLPPLEKPPDFDYALELDSDSPDQDQDSPVTS